MCRRKSDQTRVGGKSALPATTFGRDGGDDGILSSLSIADGYASTLSLTSVTASTTDASTISSEKINDNDNNMASSKDDVLTPVVTSSIASSYSQTALIQSSPEAGSASSSPSESSAVAISSASEDSPSYQSLNQLLLQTHHQIAARPRHLLFQFFLLQPPLRQLLLTSVLQIPTHPQAPMTAAPSSIDSNSDDDIVNTSSDDSADNSSPSGLANQSSTIPGGEASDVSSSVTETATRLSPTTLLQQPTSVLLYLKLRKLEASQMADLCCMSQFKSHNRSYGKSALPRDRHHSSRSSRIAT
ncbi:hypothetical protein Cantr_05961 [Candida viswanathii]|uniref:Uncharacterized protein n=1 Tax=Candida viswanathii TaxID=5486 RepID=A0A367XRN5_9ASCO|nr:hypothetical protein Cantr_05961 [Candida viswanathii]